MRLVRGYGGPISDGAQAWREHDNVAAPHYTVPPSRAFWLRGDSVQDVARISGQSHPGPFP